MKQFRRLFFALIGFSRIFYVYLTDFFLTTHRFHREHLTCLDKTNWPEVSNSWILNDISRKSLLGNGKKIAKFIMRTFTCRSTFLYDSPVNNKFTSCDTTSAPSRYGTLIKNCFQINSLAQQGPSIFLFKKRQNNLMCFERNEIKMKIFVLWKFFVLLLFWFTLRQKDFFSHRVIEEIQKWSVSKVGMNI